VTVHPASYASVRIASIRALESDFSDQGFTKWSSAVMCRTEHLRPGVESVSIRG
jgi:hypothetical protein